MTVTVRAIFDKLDGTPPIERQVELELRDSGYVWMRGGPTGYESLPLIPDYPAAKDWAACFGTPGRWAQCVVPGSEMARAMTELAATP